MIEFVPYETSWYMGPWYDKKYTNTQPYIEVPVKPKATEPYYLYNADPGGFMINAGPFGSQEAAEVEARRLASASPGISYLVVKVLSETKAPASITTRL